MPVLGRTGPGRETDGDVAVFGEGLQQAHNVARERSASAKRWRACRKLHRLTVINAIGYGVIRTELVVAGPAVSRSSADYAISYRINDGQPVQLAAGSPSFGTGAAFTGDVVRLLQSLPEEGDIAVHLSTRTGAAQDGSFLLGGLKMVREKVAAACNWPHTIAEPRN